MSPALYYQVATPSSVWETWTYSTNSTTTADTVWPTWIAEGSALTPLNSTADATWTIWSHDGTAGTASTITCMPAWGTWTSEVVKRADARAVAEEQQRERERQRLAASALRERDRIEQEREQKAAVARAEELLSDHLNERQKADYDRMKAFLVDAPSGRTYRIKKGWAGNVELLNDEGVAIMRFCIHPSESCPEQDNMLAQKLLLEHDEEAFNRIANQTPLAAVR